MASSSIIGSVSTSPLGKPAQSWPGSYVEFNEQLPSLSPDRSHNEVDGIFFWPGLCNWTIMCKHTK
jgi:hypothetical protein